MFFFLSDCFIISFDKSPLQLTVGHWLSFLNPLLYVCLADVPVGFHLFDLISKLLLWLNHIFQIGIIYNFRSLSNMPERSFFACEHAFCSINPFLHLTSQSSFLPRANRIGALPESQHFFINTKKIIGFPGIAPIITIIQEVLLTIGILFDNLFIIIIHHTLLNVIPSAYRSFILKVPVVLHLLAKFVPHVPARTSSLCTCLCVSFTVL